MNQMEFSTSDYGLANWLVFNRVELLGAVELPNEYRKNFVFLYEDRILELAEEWGEPFSEPDTEPARTCKKFFRAHAYIKKNLRESIRVSDIARPT